VAGRHRRALYEHWRNRQPLYAQCRDPMYGVSGIFYEPSDARAHGLDERVAKKSLYDGREFMYQMVKQLAQ